jgi:predicted Zn finger-like uncharacterized protein
MILTCPNCGTQYVVKDGAIPPQGRQVRCANCKHSWHQEPDDVAAPADEPVATDAEPQQDEETLAEATLIDPRSGPEAEERAYEEAMIEGDSDSAAEPIETDEAKAEGTAQLAAERHAQALSADIDAREVAETPLVASADWRPPPQPEATDDEFSPFPTADETTARRRSPAATILIVLIAVAALAAAFYFLVPADLKARIGLGSGVGSQLALVTTHMDRQRLESGNELLTVTGRVINPTGREQSVPPLQAQLRSKSGTVVYSWTIAPPARSLAPGASASFNSAEVNVPPGGDELTITLGEPRA